MKNLFIVLEVQDGERVHAHRILTHTRCASIDFAAQWYAAHFWGDSYFQDGAWYACGGEISITATKVKEISDSEANFLTELFSF